MNLRRTLLVLLGLLLASAATAADRRIVGNDDAGLAAMVAERREAWSLREVEFERIGSGDLELREVEVFGSGSRVVANNGLGEMSLARPATRFLRGTVNGIAGSVVALTVADDEITGLATDGNLVWTLRRRAADRRLEAVAVDAARDGPRQPFQCGFERLQQPQRAQRQSAVPEVPAVAVALPAGQLYQVTVAIETDFEFFQLFGSTAAATNYIGSLFNYVSAIYELEIQTRLVVGDVFLWTTAADPWVENGSTDCRLFEFGRYWRDNRGGVNRTLAHFLSGRALGGGIAWLDELCGAPNSSNQATGCASVGSDFVSGGFGVSANLDGFFSTPSGIAWDAAVVAHEIGHNFNSPHSHCYRNIGGNSQPVDACYRQETGAGCYFGLTTGLPGIGSLSGGTAGGRNGTIMSYCHLLGGGDSNIAGTFGLGHPYGVQPDRIPTRMGNRVAAVAAADPLCIPVIGNGNVTLDVSRAGAGSGTVISNPAGINCGADCTESYAGGTGVTLTAAAAAGSVFAGWSGACSGTTATCNLTMSEPRSVTATFDLASYTLTVAKSGSGSGTVTSNPAGINCGGNCSSAYVSGTVVTLSAAADGGSVFTGWSGACTGTGSCQVGMTQARSVTASFALIPDTTPDPFSFIAQTGVAEGSVRTSNAITPTGFNTAAPVTVSGGLYSIGCSGGFTASPGSIGPGQSICLRHTAAAAPSTTVTTTVSIGGVGGSFSSTTAAPVLYLLSVVVAGTGSGTVASSPAGIVCGADCAKNYVAGTQVTLTATAGASSTFSGWSGGGCSGTGSCVVTLAAATTVTANFSFVPDLVPDAFGFVAQNGVAVGATVTSASITPAGYNVPSPLSVAGGEYSINCSGTFTSAAAALFPGQSICLRHLAAATAGTTVTTTLTLGGVAGSFSSTTAGSPPQLLTVLRAGSGSGTVTSTPAGIDCGSDCSESFAAGTAVTLGATAGEGSTFVGWSGGCTGSGACNLTMTGATTVTATFALIPDTTPDPFAFAAQADVTAGSLRVSSTIVPAGFDAAAPVSVVNGEYSIGCGAGFTAAAGMLNPGQSICVRHVAAATPSTTVTTLLTVGGVTGSFSSTTAAPVFHSLSVLKTGNGSGMVGSLPAGIACGGDCAESYLAGTVVTLAATADAGSTFTGWSGGGCSGIGTCVVTMNAATTVSAGFAIVVDTTPDPFAFDTQTGVVQGATVTSNAIAPAGYNAPAPISVSGGQYAIGCSNFTAAAGSIGPGQSVCLRHTAAAAAGTTVTTTLTIGGASGSFSSTTATAVLPPLAFTPDPLGFSGQSMFTRSRPRQVGIVNVSGAALAVGTLAVTGPFALLAHDCGAVLAAGGGCTAQLTFTPPAEGPHSGALSIATGAGNAVLALAGNGERSLVVHYYGAILDRDPEPDGKAYWNAEAARVQALGADLNEVWYALAMAFFNGSEYAGRNRSDSQFIDDLYRTFLNRDSDAAGRAFWLGQLAGGLTREVVLVAFMFSDEFRAFTASIFGSTAVRPELNAVMDFYRGLLARLPDDGGFGFWVGRFRAAQCAGAAAVTVEAEAISGEFARGAEYAARSRDESEYVGDLYNAVLRRGGDPAGVQFWINAIAGGVLTREQVRQQFVHSPEFQARVAQIIAAGCLP